MGTPVGDEGGTHENADESRYRLAVAVGDPGYVEQLMRTARDVASDRGGEVLVVSVIVKSRDSPFGFFSEEVIKREFAGDRREILDRAVAMGEDADVPVEGELLVASDLARALGQAVREFDCDALLLGWQERSRTDAVLGRNVDRLVRRAPADVLVEKIGPTANGVERVLLPAAPGANTELAAAVARAIARGNDARVDVLRVIPPDASEEERRDARDLVADLAATFEDREDRENRVDHGNRGTVPVETHVEESTDVADALVEATATRDVTVLGATGRGFLRRLVVGPTPERVARRARSTVIVTRRAPRVRRGFSPVRIGRWLQGIGRR